MNNSTHECNCENKSKKTEGLDEIMVPRRIILLLTYLMKVKDAITLLSQGMFFLLHTRRCNDLFNTLSHQVYFMATVHLSLFLVREEYLLPP